MSNNKTLYELNAEMDELFSMIILDEEGEAEFKERFAKLDMQLSDKLLACRHMLRTWDHQMTALREEEKQFATRRHSLQSAYKAVIGRVRATMESMETKKFLDPKTSLGFRLQNNPPKLEIHDQDKVEGALPQYFTIEMVTKVDKKGLLAHIKETGEVPDGCEVVQDRSVRTI